MSTSPPHAGGAQHAVPHPPRTRAPRRLRRPQSPPRVGERIPEWHLLSPPQRTTEWTHLRAWVTWLTDRYELSIEERLPHCWAEHPGLVEELRALKTWREEIYSTDGPAGQAARYWHTEMRATITAALTWYAAGCRAGHRGAATTAATDIQLQRRWKNADPAAGIPPGLLAAYLTRGGRAITAEAMDRAIQRGHARPLATSMPTFATYQGHWWTQSPGGWLEITDAERNQHLAEAAHRLALADAAVAATRPPTDPTH